MKIYKVQIKNAALYDLYSVERFIETKNTLIAAVIFISNLQKELNSLSYLADVIKKSDFETAKQYNKKAKVFITKNRKWSIIFHTFRNFVVVDRIIPAKMMTH